MELQKLRNFSQLSRALFSDFNQSSTLSKEALTLTALHQLTDDQALEKATQTLLKKARESPSAPIQIENPFYRLSPEFRFILVALHQEKWSYPRLAKTLHCSPLEVEEQAWQARFELSQLRMNPIQYPAGSTIHAVDCPEYSPSTPWTQRFLDGQMQNHQRLFLQHHLMSCASCRTTLANSREVYFGAEKSIPQFEKDSSLDLATHGLDRAWKETRRYLGPDRDRVGLSIRRLLKMRDIQILVGVLFLLIIYRLL